MCVCVLFFFNAAQKSALLQKKKKITSRSAAIADEMNLRRYFHGLCLNLYLDGIFEVK